VGVNGEVVKGLGEGGETRRAERPIKSKPGGNFQMGMCLRSEAWFLKFIWELPRGLGGSFFLRDLIYEWPAAACFC
jgi:hypothetical protein